MAGEFDLLFRLLSTALLAQACLGVFVGALYLLSTFFDLGGLTQAQGRRVARALGLMILFTALGQGGAAYVGNLGGVVAYIRMTGDPTLGYFVLTNRTLSSVFLIVLIVTSLVRWAHVIPAKTQPK